MIPQGDAKALAVLAVLWSRSSPPRFSPGAPPLNVRVFPLLSSRSITDVRMKGVPSIVPATRAVHHNLIIANYFSFGAIDDGSSYFDVHDNFLAYGEHGLKSVRSPRPPSPHHLPHERAPCTYLSVAGGKGG